MSDILTDLALLTGAPAFALIHRPGARSDADIDVLLGTAMTVATVADLPVRSAAEVGRGHDLVAVLPYRQITERGFACVDDHEPIRALRITRSATISVVDALAAIQDVPLDVREAGFDTSDAEYADIVRRVLADEIGTGAGANFVIRREFTATIDDFDVPRALALFRRLLRRECGAYWVFCVHTGTRTFVGATPERHVSLRAGQVVMNPISGTYRYPGAGPDLPGVLDFLADRKETDELFMVVDEELKMMAALCPTGGRVRGPFLKEMGSLAHTEYLIEGDSPVDVRRILRETMFAPTVTGSPLENACRVISRYETSGRGYYSGVVALIGRDDDGRPTLDSAITIRTADIDQGGRLRLGVGATLVRMSDPDTEIAETHAKAAAMVAALTSPVEAQVTRDTVPRLSIRLDPRVRGMLRRRNATLARFWLADDPLPRPGAVWAGSRCVVVDAEDTFTAMLARQLEALGVRTDTTSYRDPFAVGDADFVVLGPGPGDPRTVLDPKIAALRRIANTLLERGTPTLAVCLGHQVLAACLGLDLVRRTVPNQGTQLEIDVFGRRERVGFYNTYAAVSEHDRFVEPYRGAPVEVWRDQATGQVHALRSASFASVQFHPESVLTQHGPAIITEALSAVLPGRPIVAVAR